MDKREFFYDGFTLLNTNLPHISFFLWTTKLLMIAGCLPIVSFISRFHLYNTHTLLYCFLKVWVTFICIKVRSWKTFALFIACGCGRTTIFSCIFQLVDNVVLDLDFHHKYSRGRCRKMSTISDYFNFFSCTVFLRSCPQYVFLGPEYNSQQ